MCPVAACLMLLGCVFMLLWIACMLSKTVLCVDSRSTLLCGAAHDQRRSLSSQCMCSLWHLHLMGVSTVHSQLLFDYRPMKRLLRKTGARTDW